MGKPGEQQKGLELHSLSDAALQYCWDIVTVQRGKPTSEDLRYQLKQALSRGNNRDLEDVCLKTFDWG
jgi:hypothetical protein